MNAASSSPSTSPTHADALEGAPLGATLTLPQFLAQTGVLTEAERRQIVDEARTMIEQLYVHLPLKRAIHATDPVQRLKLLRFRLAQLSERQFHDEMIDIFTDLRDLHTNYILPEPYQSKTAFLPFLVEEFWEDGTRRYAVSKLFAGFTHPTFKPGAIVTSWNGVPIERTVELNADRQAGSNPDARHARGLEALTIRAMAMSLPPDEQWVIVGYLDGTTPHEIRLDWQVFEPDPSPHGAAPLGGTGATARVLGLDLRTEIARRAKKVLFNRPAMRTERAMLQVTARGAAANTAGTSTMPDVFTFKPVATPGGTVGYVRIWTFLVDDENAFVAEFIRILGLLPQTGLIVDVRGNGGGNILCAEKLLQVLTPRPVEVTLLSFINTSLTQEICAGNAFVSQWAPSIEQSVETGETYSQGFAILPAAEYNRLGQRYQGPVVLITDPLCYSATDIFSAGFQDNQIGPILSAGGRTGAGGANVWDYALLQEVLPGPASPFGPLPNGASFRVAIRRVVRSGTHRGVPLEDLGVAPDATHRLSRNDLFNGNADLLAAAAKLLAGQPRVSLGVKVTNGVNGQRTLTIATAGLDRADVEVDGRPRATVDATDAAAVTAQVSVTGAGQDIAVRGFSAGELRAVAHVES